MNSKRSISILLIFMMLFSLSTVLKPGVYADTIPYSAIDLSTGHSFPVNVIIGPDDMLYVTEYSGNKVMKMDKDGQNRTTFATGFSQPIGMVFDGSGNLYVAEHNGSKVTKVTSTGTTSLVKSVGGGYLTGLVIDSNNKIFAIDYTAGKIYKMDLNGGNFETFKSGLPTTSLIGIAIDAQDNLFVSDRTNGKVLKIQPNGTVTDFITGVSSIQSVSLGKDGYFYTASSNRTIIKADVNGTKLTTYSTGTVNPWGPSVDKDGYIYFGESSTTVRKIVGSSETLNKTSITLNMLKEINGTVADPAAFTVSGVATNPQVTNVVVSGSSVILTLNAGMSTLDTNIKVNYTKTGTNDLKVSGTADLFNNFSNLAVKNNILRVLSVANIPQINVANGTNLSSVNLPSTATLNLSNSTTTSAAITWNSGTPAFDGNIAGAYAFSGTFSVGENVSNPNNVKASVNVIVGTLEKPIIDSVATIADIKVANGTSSSQLGLPSTVTVNLSNSTTSTAAVTWDGGTPAYNGNIAVTYTFNGAVTTGAAITNPSNLTAIVNVIVQEAAKNDKEPKTSLSDPVVKSTVNYGADVIVNGIKASAGIENTTVVGGRLAKELVVNAKTIDTMIDQALKAIVDAQSTHMPVPNNNTVVIPVVNGNSDVITIKLTGDIVKRLDDNKFSINIETNKGNYVLPAQEMKISEIAKNFNLATDLQKIVLDVQINVSLPAVTEMLNNAVKANGNMVVVSQPLEFKIIASSSETKETVEISKFTSYVEREVLLPSTVDMTKITTGVLIEPNGQLRHIPTKVFTLNNNNYANIQSLTNSDYSVVYNPITVASVEGHWAQTAVNDLASRLIIDNPTKFDPNVKITRGEFATMLTKALGLYRTEGPKVIFKDVKATDPNAVGIAFAAEYKLISGYSDGNFKPEQQITRQEAMVIFAKAMKLAGMPTDVKANLAGYSDVSQVAAWAKTAATEVTSSKVMLGVGANKISPKSTFTAAEAACAVRNLLISGDMINQ